MSAWTRKALSRPDAGGASPTNRAGAATAVVTRRHECRAVMSAPRHQTDGCGPPGGCSQGQGSDDLIGVAEAATILGVLRRQARGLAVNGLDADRCGCDLGAAQVVGPGAGRTKEGEVTTPRPHGAPIPLATTGAPPPDSAATPSEALQVCIDRLYRQLEPRRVRPAPVPRPGARPDQLGPGGRTRDGWRLLLLAQANAFTGVLTGAGDTLDLRHAALRRGWHTHPGGGVLHLTHGHSATGAGVLVVGTAKTATAGAAAIATANPPARISRRTGL